MEVAGSLLLETHGKKKKNTQKSLQGLLLQKTAVKQLR